MPAFDFHVLEYIGMAAALFNERAGILAMHLLTSKPVSRYVKSLHAILLRMSHYQS